MVADDRKKTLEIISVDSLAPIASELASPRRGKLPVVRPTTGTVPRTGAEDAR